MVTKNQFRKQVKFLFIAWFIICLLLFSQFGITEWFRPELFTNLQIFAYPLVRLIIGFMFIILMIIPGYNYFKSKTSGIKMAGYILLGFGYVFLYCLLSILAYQIINLSLDLEKFISSAIEEILTYQHHVITYYLMMISILMSIDYLQERIAEVQNREQLEKELSNDKLLMLKN